MSETNRNILLVLRVGRALNKWGSGSARLVLKEKHATVPQLEACGSLQLPI